MVVSSLVLDDCLLHSNPCVHGICVDQLNDYFCQCSTNYTGKNCSQQSKKVETIEMCIICILFLSLTLSLSHNLS